MRLNERQIAMLRELYNQGGLLDNHTLHEVAGDVSRETIRKDLHGLETGELVNRMHGKTELRADRLDMDIRRRLGVLTRAERQEQIHRLLEKRNALRVSTLTHMFNVSESTIRSDVSELQTDGKIEWEFGTIRRLEPRSGSHLHFGAGTVTFSDRMRSAAHRAVQLLSRQNQIFLDNSDFSLCVANLIPHSAEIVVWTASLRVGLVIAQSEGCLSARIIGGEVDSATLSARRINPAGLPERIGYALFAVGGACEGTLYAESASGAEAAREIAPRAESTLLYVPSKAIGRRTQEEPFRFDATVVEEVLSDDTLDSREVAKAVGMTVTLSVEHRNYRVVNAGIGEQRIGVSVLDEDNEYSKRFVANLEEVVRKERMFEMVVANNHRDTQTTLRNIETFLELGVDAIVEYQQEAELGPAIAERVAPIGIPLIAVDVAIPGAFFFGANNYRAGQICGSEAIESAIRRWGSPPEEIVFVSDDATGSASGGRIRGTLDVLRERSDVQSATTREIRCGNDSLDAEQTFSDEVSLGDHRRRLVFCTNSVVGEGVIRSIPREHSAKTLVAVHNSSSVLRAELSRQDSPLVGIVEYHPEQYGESILKILANHASGVLVPAATYIDHSWTPAIDR